MEEVNLLAVCAISTTAALLLDIVRSLALLDFHISMLIHYDTLKSLSQQEQILLFQVFRI